MDALADRRRVLLEELRELDTPDHTLQAEQRRGEILEALRAERASVEAKVRRVAHLADGAPVETPWQEPHHWPAAGVYRARLAEQADAIDAEIARVSAH